MYCAVRAGCQFQSEPLTGLKTVCLDTEFQLLHVLGSASEARHGSSGFQGFSQAVLNCYDVKLTYVERFFMVFLSFYNVFLNRQKCHFS